MIDEKLTEIASADPYGREGGRSIAEAGCCPIEKGLNRERTKRRFFGRLPDHRIPTRKSQGSVPGPDGYREVESRNYPGHSQGVPGFHHAVSRALGRNG